MLDEDVEGAGGSNHVTVLPCHSVNVSALPSRAVMCKNKTVSENCRTNIFAQRRKIEKNYYLCSSVPNWMSVPPPPPITLHNSRERQNSR
jgi:hypothetical protein